MPGDSPRVRFAPSPTGYLHVGSARAALFNWLVARQSGGTFVLRIEDTDTERNREEWVDGILRALALAGHGRRRGALSASRSGPAVPRWPSTPCGTPATSTPVTAPGRWSTRGRRANPTPGYDGFCRDRGLERGAGRALRFRTPDEGTTVVARRDPGGRRVPHAAMEDFVVVKSSGQPLFVLANVVDDIDMAITHVIRGEDLLPTTPKGLLLWGALASAGWQTDGPWPARQPHPGLPVFAHLPLLVNEEGRSCRSGGTRLRSSPTANRGICRRRCGTTWPSRLEPSGRRGDLRGRPVGRPSSGWSEVNHSPAFFDVVKLKHMNGEYIRALTVEAFIEAAQPWLTGPEAPWPAEAFDESMFIPMAPLVQERVALLSEVPDMVDFFFVDEPPIDPDSWDKAFGDEVGPAILTAAIPAYESLAAGEGAGWTVDALHQATLSIGEQFGRKLGKAQAPIRVAVTGRRVGPPLFDALVVLGPDRVMARLRAALERLLLPS